MKKPAWYLSFMSLLLFSFPEAYAGGFEGHGGDAYTIQFYSAAQYGLAMLRKWGPEQLPKIDRDALSKAIDQTKLDSADIVTVEGVEKDAKNTGEAGSITVSRTHWDALGTDMVKKSTVALHEYLGILGMEYDSAARVSYLYSQKIDELEFLPTRVKLETEFASLQNDFKSGHSPSILELHVGQIDSHTSEFAPLSWTCSEYSKVGPTLSKVTSKGRYLFTDKMSPGVPQNFGFNHITAYNADPNSKSKVGSFTDTNETYFESIRALGNGDLVVELSTAQKYSSQDPSVLQPEKGALSYFRCSLFKETLKQKVNEYAIYSERVLNYDNSSTIQAVENLKSDPSYTQCLKVLGENPRKAKQALKVIGEFSVCFKINDLLDEVVKQDHQNALLQDLKDYSSEVTDWMNQVNQSSGVRAQFAFKEVNEVRQTFVNSNSGMLQTLGAVQDRAFTKCRPLAGTPSHPPCVVDALKQTFIDSKDVMKTTEQNFKDQLPSILKKIDDFQE